WYGATTVIASTSGHKDINYLLDMINTEKINIIHFVPSMLISLLTALDDQEKVKLNLKYIFCSGEALAAELVKKTYQYIDKGEIHNLYGPTEASVDILYYYCNNQNIDNIYIGKPINNSTVYVLNRELIPLPIGVIGELYIGGE